MTSEASRHKFAAGIRVTYQDSRHDASISVDVPGVHGHRLVKHQHASEPRCCIAEWLCTFWRVDSFQTYADGPLFTGEQHIDSIAVYNGHHSTPQL
jgi:hypothetical protein